MKTYKVTQPYPDNNMALNLVNINDPYDVYMCAEDEFILDEIINEIEFYTKEHNYVDDQGVGTAEFAYKKQTITIEVVTKLIALVDDETEADHIIQEMDYDFIAKTPNSEIIETEIRDFKLINRK